MTFLTQSTAVADALARAAAVPPSEPDATQLIFAELRHIGPSAIEAGVLLAVHGRPVTPIDPDTLDTAGDELDTLPAVLDWYRAHPYHGVGLLAAPFFAVTGIPGAIHQWLREVAVDERVVETDDNGRATRVVPTGRDLGSYVVVAPSFPTEQTRMSKVTVGDAALRAAGAGLLARDRRGRDHPTWLVWAASDRVVKPRRVADGVYVAGGVIPWRARLSTGATMSASGPPTLATPPPSWLVDVIASTGKSGASRGRV